MEAGQTQFTLTCDSASSNASVRVQVISAPFDAAYADKPGAPTIPVIDDRTTREPFRAACIAEANSRASRKAPPMFTLKIR